MTTAELRPRARGRRVATAPSSRRPALLVALALWGFALVLALNSSAVITLEAKFTSLIMGMFTFGGATSHDHLIYIGIGTGEVLGFLITPLCTSLVLATPVIVLAGALLLFPRYRVSWVLKGVLIALPLAVGANTARFVLVGVALQLWGRGGFEVMHHYVGSVLVLLCSALALVLLLVVATTGRVRIPRSWLDRLGRRD
ncbi:exosortase/archaeosortase family protein [Microbacteriaceae bacterium SG_E_30_P1]|uniref:Exosortase/archaeosortase family protein n=1 Tax=Antiquaquibacter oligotrophicus TaxID=2880260 RepID=A0ABT6KSY7_9MICO|nr:archaeosortase/exosortase family protein [Antiquaquibacter oligotrophicus]MDH6182289.1 exosortase/archaeosortase family protein [Antiquaquibacter oligotrophicus]UDF12055.1 archaeosortase/exosortase family protein [Antiquaquibacter oligotrophicus]